MSFIIKMKNLSCLFLVYCLIILFFYLKYVNPIAYWVSYAKLEDLGDIILQQPQAFSLSNQCMFLFLWLWGTKHTGTCCHHVVSSKGRKKKKYILHFTSLSPSLFFLSLCLFLFSLFITLGFTWLLTSMYCWTHAHTCFSIWHLHAWGLILLKCISAQIKR